MGCCTLQTFLEDIFSDPFEWTTLSWSQTGPQRQQVQQSREDQGNSVAAEDLYC